MVGRNLKCKCGNRSRFKITQYKDEDSGKYSNYGGWINIACRKCGNSLYYNGA